MITSLLAAAIVATNLPPVIVEASRLERSPLELPSAVHVFTPQAIQASGAESALDLLARKAPELQLRHLGGGNPALAEIAMRGYGENGFGRTLVLVDGERLNAPDMTTPNLSRIALAGVTKIEILGGAQTVLHGDGASAGVVNVITEPQDDEQKSYAEIRGGSWGTTGVTAGTRGGIPEDGLKYWADASYDRADGYREHSGYDLWNLNAGLKETWDNGTSLRFSGFFNDAQYDLPGALTREQWRANPRQSFATEDRYRRTTFGFASTLRAELNEENAMKLTGNFSSRRMRAHQRGTGWFSDNDFDIYSYRLLGEWINTTQLGSLENEALSGVQYSTDRLSGEQLNNFNRQRPNYSRQFMDFYAQDTLHFTTAVALQFGGRYSRVWAANDLCERKRRVDDLAAVDLALLVNPTADAKLYLKASRFYRAPFLDEVPGRFDAGYNWMNTKLLAPETGYMAEVGGEWQPSEEFSLGADVYGSRLDDEIFYNAPAGNNENSAAATWRCGADVHLTWERDKLAGLSLAVSTVHAAFHDGVFDGHHIPLVPKATATANGRIWLWDDCYVFGGARYQSAMYSCSDFGNAFERIPGFTVFHLGATYEPSDLAILAGFKLTVTVDNLFDRNYCDYATYGTEYYPAAGRSLTVSLRYEY